MRRSRIVLTLILVAALSIPAAAQYGWFSLNGGLIARLSSSTTAATIRQDGSGAVLDLYAGTTLIFRAAQNALFTVTGTMLSTVAYIVGSQDTSGCRIDVSAGVLRIREGDNSADCPMSAATITSSSNIDSGGRFLAPSTGYFGWNGRALVRSSADGVVSFRNAAESKTLLAQFSGTPTCSSNCGTSPSVTGVDSAMTVTMGATGVPASGWVVTFNGTWDAAPSCIVQSALAGMVVGKMPIVVATTTTTITVTTNGTAPATSDKYHILCMRGA